MFSFVDYIPSPELILATVEVIYTCMPATCQHVAVVRDKFQYGQ